MTTTQGALELSKVLLDNVGGLKAGTLPRTGRNSASSLLIDAKARDFYGEIGKLIATIDKNPVFEWPVFKKYTDAIDPLERLLLRLLTVTFSPINENIPPNNSTASAVTFINRWETDKIELLAALDDLRLPTLEVLSSEVSAGSAISKARNADDFAILKELDTKLDRLSSLHEGRLAQKDKKHMTNLRSTAKSIKGAFADDTKTHDPKLATLAVKSVMATYTLYAVLFESATNREWQKHLSSFNIWDAANRLLADVYTSIESGEVASIGKLEAAYKAFEGLLLKQAALGNELLDVARKAGAVRRPFHGRSVVLVTMCYVLQEQSKNSKDGPMNLRLLSEVFSTTLTALTNAAGNTTGDIQSFVTTGETFKKVVQDFVVATSKAQECFTNYKLEQWTEYEKSFNAAVKMDHLHLLDLKKRLNLVAPDGKYEIADNELAGSNAE